MKLYNTLTKQVEDFKSIKPKQVKMYVCGPTPQDKSHIGHAKVYITFDFVRRFLEFKGNQVDMIINITDIFGTILEKAQEVGVQWQVVPDINSRYFLEMLPRLRIKPPTTFPRVTNHIQEIIHMVQTLLEKDYAYRAPDGVYFDVSKFPGYGKLGRRELGDPSVSRIEPSPHKRNPADFALWIAHKPGEPFWHAPFGKGRPGWHIECSAMSKTYLGKTLDIHGGGADLIFPHHDNEIAQSEAANDAKFVNYWMHVAFLTLDKTKMSKSLGNFITVDDMLSKYPAELIRYYLLSAHYRTQLDFTWEKMDAARLQWDKLVRAWYQVMQREEAPGREDVVPQIKQAETRMVEALDNDLATPAAYAAIHKVAGLVAQENMDMASLKAAKAFFEKVDQIFAFLPPQNWTPRELKMAKMLAELREVFRRNKDFKISDEVREHLRKEGVEIDDSKQGPKIRFV